MKWENVIEWLKSFLVALIIVLIVYQFVLVAKIDGHSMEPTLHDGNHVITTRKFYELDYGDVIAFDFETDTGEREYHVKRIIGLPGDQIKISQKEVLVNGTTVIEDGKLDYGEQTYKLAEDEYFVVGDNYGNSYDSREHGPIKKRDILGKVSFFLPF